MRHQGKPVKRWWFVRQGKQIIDELEPDHNFLFLNHWFERFQNLYNISLRRKTHCSQKPLRALEPATKKFHSSLLRLRNTGNFKASDLANMTPSPDAFTICVTLIGLNFADFSSIRENKYPQKIWNDAKRENKYPRKN